LESREAGGRTGLSARFGAYSVALLALAGASTADESKRDLSDWLDAGHTVGELRKLARNAPEWKPEPGPRSPVMVCMADVEPHEVEWLWHPYIPLGKLTFLDGDPGLGKSWLSLELCAIVSRGFPWLDQDGKPGEGREPADALLLICEDGLADTIRPRLDKASADVARVYVLVGTQEGNAVTLQDVDTPREALDDCKPALVVVDPIQGFLGDADMNAANKVRPILSGLGKLAEEHRAAILCIRHLRKSEAEKAIYRGLGSIDLMATARSAFLVGRDPADESRLLLAHYKSNLAKLGRTLAFTLEEGRFRWAGVSDLSAKDHGSARVAGRDYPRPLPGTAGRGGQPSPEKKRADFSDFPLTRFA